MAEFQSEIELRVKVVDKELKELEKRIEKVTNPFSASGSRKNKGVEAQKGALQVEKNRLQLQTKLTGQAVKQLNLNTSWLKALEKAKGIRASYAKDAEKAAKSAEREKRAVERTAALNKKKRSNRFESLALGGGFPLLFGGGIGQSLAGLAGAGLGPALGLGSMGGGIAFQAVAAGITQATTALTETAAVAGSVGDAYDFLTEKSLFASDETQALADKLAELGDVEKLAEAVTQELVNLIGNEGVQNLKALDDEVDTFQKEIGKLGLAIGSFLSQYLAPLIDKFNSVLGTINTANAFETRRKEIVGTDREADFNRRVKELSTPGARGSTVLGEAQQKILLKEFGAIVEEGSNIDPTLEDRKRFTPPKAGGAGKKPYDPTKRIADLTAEAALITKIAEQDRQINNAQVARQSLTVIELQLNKELERIEAKRLDMIRNSKAPDAERAAINAVAAAKASAAQTEAAGKAYKFLKQNEESTAKQVEQMGLQTQLADALTREEQKQLKLQIGLLKIREANKGKSVEQLEALEKGFRELFAAQNLNPIEAYAKKLQTNLADVETKVVQMAQVVETQLGAAMSSALIGLVDGTKTVQEAFSEMFAKIGQSFIQMATEMLAQKAIFALLQAFQGPSPSGLGTGNLFGSGGVSAIGGGSMVNPFSPRASGGAAMGNRPYMVGETGPELFIPQTSGRVVNNSDTMDRYSYQDNAPVAAPRPIDVQYNVTEINGMRFVTEDQLQRASAAAAKQGAKSGETRVMASLRNSRSRRKSIGI